MVDMVTRLHEQSLAHMQAKDYVQAVEVLERAVQLAPQAAALYANLGVSLQNLGRFAEALQHYDSAVALQPSLVQAWSNRGNSLHRLGRSSEALQSFAQAMAIDPAYAPAWSNRGNTLMELGDTAAALADFERAMALRPNYAEAIYNRGNALRELGRVDEALASYAQARAVQPDHVHATWNLALTHLARGELRAAWPLYEARWQLPDFKSMQLQLPQPLWLGREPIMGKTLLVWSEQGFGDTMLGLRYVSLLCRMGAKVTVAVDTPLLRLVQTSLAATCGADEVLVIAKAAPYPTTDFHCPILSLPLACKTCDVADIPGQVPYLHVDPSAVAAMRTRMDAHAEAVGQGQGSRQLGGAVRRIGMVWAGGFRPNIPDAARNDAKRSLPLRAFEPLGQVWREVGGVQFFSLQKGPAREQLREVQAQGWRGPPIADLTDELKDWADTAALMKNLDLLISCDTATANLAPALGVPTWVLHRLHGDWRWEVPGEPNPWFGAARVYRQEIRNDWRAVMTRICGDLNCDDLT